MKIIKRVSLQILGVLLILLFFTPLPGGTFAMVMGLTLLVCTSLRFALFVQSGRRKFPKFDRGLRWAEDKISDKISGGLKFTRPENDPRDHVK